MILTLVFFSSLMSSGIPNSQVVPLVIAHTFSYSHFIIPAFFYFPFFFSIVIYVIFKCTCSLFIFIHITSKVSCCILSCLTNLDDVFNIFPNKLSSSLLIFFECHLQTVEHCYDCFPKFFIKHIKEV